MRKTGLLVAGVCALLSLPADADFITFRDGFTNALSGGVEYAGTEDTGIRNSGPGVNYGTLTSNLAGRQGTGSNVEKMLIRFDLTSLTGGLAPGERIQINSATLHWSKAATASPNTLAADRTLSIYQIAAANAGWAETVSSWTYISSIADNVRWTGSAGLSTADTDYLSGVVATETVGNAAAMFSTALSTNMVQAWVDNSAVNAGVLFTMADALQGEVISIYTSEYAPSGAVSTHRPGLEINYTVIPEPATLGLLFVSSAGLLLLRRLRFLKN